MLHKVNAGDLQRVRRIFAGIVLSQPMCNAVLEGAYPGSVFIDDPTNPHCGYLQTYIGSEMEPQWGFLAGDSELDFFCRDLYNALFQREIIHSEAPMVFLTCDSPKWVAALASAVAPNPVIPSPRRHYIIRDFHQDWRAAIPQDFTIELFDQKLLQRPGLYVPEDIRQTLEKWKRIDEPKFADYGFAAIETRSNGAEVAAWATVDFVAGGMGDLGMFTRDEYRRRGLAYLTTAAAIEHGLSHGLTKISWTCMDDNTGSIRTAEKLGLERVEDYSMHLLIFDPLEARSMLAYTCLEAGRPAEALNEFESILQSGQAYPPYVLFDAARAAAQLGDKDAAFLHLKAYTDGGSPNPAVIEECRDFAILHESPVWTKILQQARARAKAK